MSSFFNGISAGVTALAKDMAVKNYQSEMDEINRFVVLSNIATVTSIALLALAVSFGSVICLFLAGIVFVGRLHADSTINARVSKIYNELKIVGQQDILLGGNSYLYIFRRPVHIS